ncbi:MAG: hypothetical protein QOC71_224, partial [Thermoplasmata archaeon]|nr:hypothetical protein [Thermoplasmata archaeon]
MEQERAQCGKPKLQGQGAPMPPPWKARSCPLSR